MPRRRRKNIHALLGPEDQIPEPGTVGKTGELVEQPAEGEVTGEASAAETTNTASEGVTRLLSPEELEAEPASQEVTAEPSASGPSSEGVTRPLSPEELEAEPTSQEAAATEEPLTPAVTELDQPVAEAPEVETASQDITPAEETPVSAVAEVDQPVEETPEPEPVAESIEAEPAQVETSGAAVEPHEPESAEDHEPEEASEGGEPAPVPAEDAFAEIRQSLREEEKSRKPGFFTVLRNKLFRRKRPEPVEAAPEEPEPLEEQLPPELPFRHDEEAPAPAEPAPAETEQAEPAQAEPAQEQEAYVQAFDSLLNPAAEEPEDKFTPRKKLAEPEAPEEPHRSMLSSIRPAPETETEEEGELAESDLIRQAALEDYVAVPEEPVEETGKLPLDRWLKRFWRSMQPLERRMLVASLGLILAAMMIGSTVLVVGAIIPDAPLPTPTAGLLPYPVKIELPGGWSFPLNRGIVQQDGKWQPAQAEWLQGTEICRWVSLPWSVQLEAVVRTLKSSDEIKLSMSNSDDLVYKVRSIENLSDEQLQGISSKQACLLVILTQAGSDTHWAVNSVP